jgi:dienelactone hydrolase
MKKYALLLAFCLVFVTSKAQLKPVGYTDADQKLNGVAAIPSKSLKNKPGILILPAWKGIDNHARESATALAALGYHTFIADITVKAIILRTPKRPENVRAITKNTTTNTSIVSNSLSTNW